MGVTLKTSRAETKPDPRTLSSSTLLLAQIPNVERDKVWPMTLIEEKYQVQRHSIMFTVANNNDSS